MKHEQIQVHKVTLNVSPPGTFLLTFSCRKLTNNLRVIKSRSHNITSSFLTWSSFIINDVIVTSKLCVHTYFADFYIFKCFSQFNHIQINNLFIHQKKQRYITEGIKPQRNLFQNKQFWPSFNAKNELSRNFTHQNEFKKCALINFKEFLVPLINIIGSLLFVFVVIWWWRVIFMYFDPLDHLQQCEWIN